MTEERERRLQLSIASPGAARRTARARSGRCCGSQFDEADALARVLKAERPGCRKCCACGAKTSTARRPGHPRRPPTGSRPQLGRVVTRARPAAPALDVADLGCGEGYSSIEAAQWAQQCHRRRSLDRCARARKARALARADEHHLEARRARKLPLDGRRMDVVLLSQALHHAADPALAVAEAARGLREPGGRVLVLDLRSARRELGARAARRSVARLHRRSAAGRCLTRAGLTDVRVARRRAAIKAIRSSC